MLKLIHPSTKLFRLANVPKLLQQAERGDADSSGSTLRVWGVVVLIIAVVLLIGAAILTQATATEGIINNVAYPW